MSRCQISPGAADETGRELVPIQPFPGDRKDIFTESKPGSDEAADAENQRQLDGQLPPTDLTPAIPKRFGESIRQ